MNTFIRDRLVEEALDPDSGLEIIPLTGALLEDSVTRGNSRHPPFVKAFVPDEWVTNMKGYTELRDSYFLLRLPLKPKDRKHVEVWADRVESPADENASVDVTEDPSNG